MKMTNSKQLKLYPLFRQASRVSSTCNNHNQNKRDDTSSCDSGDDDDDIPLTSLLTTRSKTTEEPSTRKKAGPSKESKQSARRADSSKISKNERGKEKRRNSSALMTRPSPLFTESTNTKQKLKKRRVESVVLSTEKKCSTERSITTASQVPITIARFSTNVVTNTLAIESNGNSKNARVCSENTTDANVETHVGRSKDEIGLSPSKAPPTVLDPKKCSRWRVGERIFSQSTMDFFAEEMDHSRASKSRNIVHAINRRTAFGGCLLQNTLNRHFSLSSKAKRIQNERSSISPSSCCWPERWKIPSWISLEQPSGGYDASGTGSIDHMTWDALGVLLAVASDRTISIYDWDMVRAADIRGRSDRARNCQDSEFKIPPILRFHLPQPVASLVWNPFEMDELAVGFRVSGQTMIYNVDRVARWQSKDPSRNSRRLPPRTTYESIVLQRVTGSIGDILFLDAQNLLVGVGNVLLRWKRSGQNRARPRREQESGRNVSGILVWRYQTPSLVTAMATIGSNVVIVGTNRGHLCLIDWRKRTKVTLSFSHEHRPKVLHTWVPHDRLKATHEDQSLRNRMGIVKMKVESSNQDCVVGNRHWGRCRVIWVTQSGWLLSTILESAVRVQENCRVHYASRKIVYKNADGSLIKTEKKSWSLPYNAVGVDLSNQLSACWVRVPDVTRILSHHDKFVLDSQPSTIVSKERSLMVHGFGDEMKSIPFPPNVNELPQSVAVHPSLEWIIVGEREKLHILVGLRRAHEIN